MPPPNDADREKVLWCGNLHDNVTEELLYELFLQAGPLESVKIVANKDRTPGKSYAFITFKHAISVPFTLQLMCGINLFGRPLQLKARSLTSSGPQDLGAPSAPSTPNGTTNINNGLAFPSPLSRVLSYGTTPVASQDSRSTYKRWQSEPEGQCTLKADQYGYGSNSSQLRHDSRNMMPQLKTNASSRNGSNWNHSEGTRRSDQSESLSVAEQVHILRNSPQVPQYNQSPMQLQQLFRQQQQHRNSPQHPYGESSHHSPQQTFSGGRHSNSSDVGRNGGGSNWQQQRSSTGYHPYGGSGNGHRRR